MIIGITGTNGAGKGTIVRILVERGFKHYSVRSFLIEEIKSRGLEVNRQNMIDVANDLRAKHGASYIVEELYKRALADGGDGVIESIRAVGEVEALRGKDGFVLFAVDADPKVRYKRVCSRAGVTDSLSFEEFCLEEAQEMESNDKSKQNLLACRKMADHFFRNESSMEELSRRVLSAIRKRGSGEEPHRRPSWDEYFMEIARAVALRGTCDRGRSGCVIARDKQILVTGYVGSPRGMPHCDEVGHLMEEWEHSDGVKRLHCVRTTHAEQNAICQAAKLGISIEGSTLYCKMLPCSSCAGMIINSGIKKVICEKSYHAGAKTPKMFNEAGIELEILDKSVEKYEGM